MMELLEAQLFYSAALSALFSLMVGLAAMELRKPSVLLLNALLGAFTGFLIGGWYLGVSGGLGGFNDNAFLILPIITGSFTGFIAPGILKARFPSFFRSLRLPVGYRSIYNAVFIMVIVSGLLSLSLFFIPVGTQSVPGGGLGMAPAMGNCSLRPGILHVSDILGRGEISRLNRVNPLGSALLYDLDIEYIRSAGFLDTNPYPGDILKFHIYVKVKDDSIIWSQPAIRLVAWGDSDGDRNIDEDEQIAISDFIWPTGEFNPSSTFRPRTLWRSTGGVYMPYMVNTLDFGYLAIPETGPGEYTRDDEGESFTYSPDSWTAPCDCFSCFWLDSDRDEFIDPGEMQPGEKANAWFSKEPGDYAEAYGQILVTEAMDNDCIWYIRASLYDCVLPLDDQIVSSSDMAFVILGNDTDNGKIQNEWMMALVLFGGGALVTAVVIPRRLRKTI